ncbi:hypothetical protein J8273_1924 [Carpediemonas membranifera]|uniref:Uncharacterized protein n=1 Tax=Carpediemonas membranifera TaxID=201153 RepID=A0A8J6E6A8_9EUKA|nr:hypothetical protein J8273_1924 [Carpediemonas membranifera]|eukprot:KAG9396877.1 hypothetical protein J8273_1924 [Carpediemonas membranifera]
MSKPPTALNRRFISAVSSGLDTSISNKRPGVPAGRARPTTPISTATNAMVAQLLSTGSLNTGKSPPRFSASFTGTLKDSSSWSPSPRKPAAVVMPIESPRMVRLVEPDDRDEIDLPKSNFDDPDTFGGGMILMCDRNDVLRPPAEATAKSTRPTTRRVMLPTERIPSPDKQLSAPPSRGPVLPATGLDLEDSLSDDEGQISDVPSSESEATEYLYQNWTGFSPYTLANSPGSSGLSPESSRFNRSAYQEPMMIPESPGGADSELDWAGYSLGGAELPTRQLAENQAYAYQEQPQTQPVRQRQRQRQRPGTPAGERFARLEAIRSQARARLYEHLKHGREQEETDRELTDRLDKQAATPARTSITRGRARPIPQSTMVNDGSTPCGSRTQPVGVAMTSPVVRAPPNGVPVRISRGRRLVPFQ